GPPGLGRRPALAGLRRGPRWRAHLRLRAAPPVGDPDDAPRPRGRRGAHLHRAAGAPAGPVECLRGDVPGPRTDHGDTAVPAGAGSPWRGGRPETAVTR